MNVRLASKTRKPQRGGFTLIELLVVISIIAVLASLMLPAVQNAREAGRRITCLNNMRNVGLAVAGYVTANNGAYPPLVGGIDYLYTNSPTTAPVAVPAPWIVHLLPYIEQAGLYERLTNSANATTGNAQAIMDLSDVNIKVLTCPDDLSSDDNGAMSFAANAGYIGSSLWGNTTETSHQLGYYKWLQSTSEDADDISTSEFAKRAISTGVFWRQNSASTVANTVSLNSTALKMTVDRIKDGTSQTLMLSENLSNGGWLPTPQGSYGAATGDVAFGLCVTDTSGAPAKTFAAVGAGNFQLTPTEQVSRINNVLTAASGTAPRPSSLHPQIVNTIFCDGSGRTLNQSINDGVYARLLSSNGNTYGHKILSGTDF